jgi:voltage-gated potassium channel
MNAQHKLDRYEKKAEWPLAAVAVVFLASYSIEVLAQPRGSARDAVLMVGAIAYLVFGIDYVARLSLAPRRWRWFVRHLFDLAIVTLPLLRPLRLLRLVILIGALNRAVGDAIRGRVIMYTISGATLLIYVSSLAILDAERSAPHSMIKNFGDALWWAIATVTTIGYGDLAPVTPTGRVVAVGLMVGGISLVGAVTATLSSWLIQRVAEEDTEKQAATAAHIDELRTEIRLLAEELRRVNGAARDDGLQPSGAARDDGLQPTSPGT